MVKKCSQCLRTHVKIQCPSQFLAKIVLPSVFSIVVCYFFLHLSFALVLQLSCLSSLLILSHSLTTQSTIYTEYSTHSERWKHCILALFLYSIPVSLAEGCACVCVSVYVLVAERATFQILIKAQLKGYLQTHSCDWLKWFKLAGIYLLRCLKYLHSFINYINILRTSVLAKKCPRGDSAALDTSDKAHAFSNWYYVEGGKRKTTTNV